MTILTAGWTLDAAKTDVARRRIAGLILPFGEAGHAAIAGKPATVTFEAGGLAWADPNQVKLVVNHTGAAPVIAGRARDLIQTDEGIYGVFAVAKTTAGDDLLVEAAEKLRTGLSVEAELPDTLTASDDGTYLVTAADPAQLRRVAAVESPAFASAQVHTVAAQKVGPMTNDLTAAEVPDEVLSGVIANLTEAVGQLNQSLASTADPDAAPEPVAASRPIGSNALTAATSVTREAFPYGQGAGGSEGGSFFSDLLASRHNPDAGQRVRKAEAMLLTAANEPITKSNAAIIPNQYSPMFVDKIWQPRDIADRIPSTSVSSAQPVLVPSVTSVFADGGSGTPVGSHSEGTNPAQGEAVFAYKTNTPAPYSGMFDINREALDAASPGLDSILLGFLRQSYNQVTEAAAVTAISGAGSIDTGSAAHNATAATKAQLLEVEFRREIAQFKARRGAKCDVVFAAPDQYEQLAVYSASDGRPLLPYTNQTNTSGGIVDNGWEGQIFGVPIINTYAMTQYKDLFVRLEDCHRWESPLLQFRWDEVAGPAKVRFVAFGYFLVGVIQPAGVSLLTQAQA